MFLEGAGKKKKKNICTMPALQSNDNVSFSGCCAVWERATSPVWDRLVSEAFTSLFHVPHLQALLHQQDSLAVVTPHPPPFFLFIKMC